MKQQSLDELHRVFDCFCSQEDPGALRKVDLSKTHSLARAASGEADQQQAPSKVEEKFSRLPSNVAGKAFGGLGERGKTMDMGELLTFYRWSGLCDCVSKSLVTKLFKEVNSRHQTVRRLTKTQQPFGERRKKRCALTKP